MTHSKSNEPDPRACPKCHKFPCACPGGGSGDENTHEEALSDDKENEESGSLVETMAAPYPDSMINASLDGFDDELILSAAPVPRPRAETGKDEKAQSNSFVKTMATPQSDAMANDSLSGLDDELILASASVPKPRAEIGEDKKAQNSRPTWCTLFARPATDTQMAPSVSSGKAARDDTANKTSCMRMGMSMSGADE